jgi:hypothetical protein
MIESPINQLPPEVNNKYILLLSPSFVFLSLQLLREILSYLDFISFGRCLLVCKSWNAIANQLQRNIYVRPLYSIPNFDYNDLIQLDGSISCIFCTWAEAFDRANFRDR